MLFNRQRNLYVLIFGRRIIRLITSKIFLVVTLVSNMTISLFAFAFYAVEHQVNSTVNSLLDAHYWAFATVTTVGYGDIVTMTTMGKLISIALMLGGTALFATYTALFANSIIGGEFSRLTHDIRRIKQNIGDVEHDLHKDDYQLYLQLKRLSESVERLEQKVNKKD